ncbi:MAG TPA: hypothetical protein VK741_22870 [Acetobacteraceae bacterium]|jgi:hypothetical protein|nr:hypothetical protein [Acetobacteraceae bacterium]
MLEFSLDDRLYRARKLTTFQQMHVLKRIGPIIGPMLALQTGADGSDPVVQVSRFLEALSGLKDEDMDFVIATCAGAVQRQQAGNGSGPVWSDIFSARAKAFMFEDLDNLPTVLEITGKVLQDNLGGFLSIRQTGDGPRPPTLAPTI